MSLEGVVAEDGLPASFWERLTWRDLGWRVACWLGCLFLVLGVAVSLFVASCGGDASSCSSPLSAPHRESYGAALNFSVGVGPLAVLPFTRNLRKLLFSAVLSFVVTLGLIVMLWP